MAVYTGVADANGDFNIPFSSNYTGGQRVAVTAEKDGAINTIELFAPSDVTGGGFLRYSGNLANFPRNIGDIVISSEVSGVISDYAFHGGTLDYNIFRCATGLTIPSTITELGSFSFANWHRATSLSILASIANIPSSCFDLWRSLASLTLPNSITSIGAYAFRQCDSAVSLTLPSNLISIANNAFQSWSKCLSLAIPNSVTTLGAGSFDGWSAATSLIISTSIQDIPNNCFYGWSKGNQILIPEGVKTIGGNSFGLWSSATLVKIPSTITTLGATAFQGLVACGEIQCAALTPPTIQSNTFANLKTTCVIKVPSSSLAAYQSAANWSVHASKMIGV